MDTNISLSRSEVLLTKIESSSNEVVVVFLPGISGKAFSERFQPLVNVSLEAGYPIARVSAWESEVDVQAQTYSYFQDAVAEVVDPFLGLGYTQVIAIGKSFGGGLVLSLHHKAIVKKILWAPAIGFTDTETVTRVKDVPLSEIDSLQGIQLSPDYVVADAATINIIHGTADTTFPMETSRKIVSAVVYGSLVEIPDADHSFKTPESERSLLEATRNFLKDQKLNFRDLR